MLAAARGEVNVDLRMLNRLPVTGRVLAVTKAYRHATTALYLDVRATNPQVVSLNGAGRLGRARVVFLCDARALGG